MQPYSRTKKPRRLSWVWAIALVLMMVLLLGIFLRQWRRRRLRRRTQSKLEILMLEDLQRKLKKIRQDALAKAKSKLKQSKSVQVQSKPDQVTSSSPYPSTDDATDPQTTNPDTKWKDVEGDNSHTAAYEAAQSMRNLRLVGQVVAIEIAALAVFRILTNKMVQRTLIKITQAAVTLLTRLAAKIGAQAAAALGLRITASLAAKAATTAAVSRVGTTALAAVLGPMGIALTAITLVGALLDILDVGGYMNMATKEFYTEVKKDMDKNFRKTLEENDIPYPLFYGPLDTMSLKDEDAYQAQQLDIMETLSRDQNDPIMVPFFEALNQQMAANPEWTEADLNVWSEENFDKFIDEDKLSSRIYELHCTKAQGRMHKGMCTYATPQECKASMKWPPTDETDDVYVEWNKEEDACMVASTAMYTVCKDAGLDYNWESGMCNITKDYCDSKGAKWGKNKNGDDDCVIPASQEVLEVIFSTTITRGLIQTFDTDQYCPCDPGELDLGYMCGNACPPEKPKRIGALCYEECPPDKPDWGFGCRSNCPEGWQDNGLFCLKPPPVGRGWGELPLVSCPSGYTTQGVGFASWCTKFKWGFIPLDIISSTTTCPAGTVRQGELCYPPCPPNYTNYGLLCSPSCPSDEWTDIGISCAKPGYERGPAEPSIRVKPRRIAYSKKKDHKVYTGNC